jgi:hypothetical protein
MPFPELVEALQDLAARAAMRGPLDLTITLHKEDAQALARLYEPFRENGTGPLEIAFTDGTSLGLAEDQVLVEIAIDVPRMADLLRNVVEVF